MDCLDMTLQILSHSGAVLAVLALEGLRLEAEQVGAVLAKAKVVVLHAEMISQLPLGIEVTAAGVADKPLLFQMHALHMPLGSRLVLG